ncbi:uncharacterized protein LOC133883338 isoform X2 [Phragmites australis]|uniref:uncharacterized protein LOC133883338 isoform X2 n=1 Tax=Phragmites australis TaxID=29695 RepID=UPI002D792B25|nr:uncharacterized protein LOC133883338 isoform X2 [Phragmites australis]
MDPHPPFEHLHHRRAHPGHHCPDQHRHHYPDQHRHHLAGGVGGGAALTRSRYDMGSHPIQYLPSDHQHQHHHHLPRVQPPPLPPPPSPPHHRHDGPQYTALPLRAPPEIYSPPPYHNPPLHDLYHQQRHGGDDFRAADEIRRVPSHHYHPPLQQHHQQLPQLPWEEAEEDRRRYAALQHRLSPPELRKRHRCAMHDTGDLESTSSSDPPPRRQRQHLHTSYTPDDSFVGRTATNPGYSRHEGFMMHSDSKGNRKIPTSASTMLPGSPHSMDSGYLRRPPQKSAPARVSVWQRIEENPSAYAPSSPRQPPKEVHISPSKTKNTGSAKELTSVVSLDCKAKNADCKDSSDSAGMKKSTGKKNEKVLASVLVKPSPESKEKERAIKKVTGKPVMVQNNVAGSTSGSVFSTACPGTGVKKVKKIVIKKIVRKINGKDKQTGTSIVLDKKDSIVANANVCEKEEGEITEKDVISAHNLVSTSDTAGVGSSVEVDKEQNDDLMNLSKSSATSAIECTDILDTTSVSGSQHPEKEDKSFMSSGDSNAASVIDSTKVLDTTGSEHPGKEEDRGSMDLGGKNAALVSENGNSHKEEGMSVSGAVNIVVASNSPRMPDAVKLHKCDVSIMENSAVCGDGIKDDRRRVCRSENGRKEDSNILIGSNEEGDLAVNNSFRSPSTAEVSMPACKDVHRKESIILMGSNEMCVASLADFVEAPKIAEPSATQGACKEEGNTLNNTRDMDIVSVSSWGSLNTMENSVHEDIQDKEGRIPMELSKPNASGTHHVNAPNRLEVSVNEDIQEKECRTPMESHEAATSVTHHEKAPNTLEVNIQNKERQMPIDSSASKTIQHVEAPNTAEVFINMFVGSDVGKSPMESNETHVGPLDNSVHTPESVVAGGTDDSCTQELLHDEKTALDKTDLHLEVADMEFTDLPLSRNVDSRIVPLDGDPMEDSSGAVVLNNDVRKISVSQAAELMHLHRAHLSPDNLSLLHSHDSPYVSGNSEHSVPTALTLGNNIYFSSAESEGQPEENHKLIEGNQGLDVVSVTDFGNINKRKGESGNDLINAGVRNWLTLPLAVNYVNNDATISMDRFGLDQIVDECTSVSQAHDNIPDMDHRGSIGAFLGQDQSLKLCGSNMPQSNLLAPEGVGNESEIVLPGSSVSSVDVLDQYSYPTMDKPVDTTNKHILLPSQSAGATAGELASSQVYVDPDHTFHSNTEDPVVESGTKPDLLSSWVEAIVSETKREHQPCKSTLLSVSSSDKLLGPKEDNRKAVSDSVVNSTVKSPPRMNITSSTVTKVPTKQVALPSSSREAPRLTQNARHRTWHRDNVSPSTSSLHASQPSGLTHKLPLKKNAKAQNSYIRKGNALIRNPATGNHPHSSSLDAQNKLSKPVMRRSLNFVRKVDSNDAVAHSNIAVERPKTPPLPLYTKSINCTTNLSEPLSQTLQTQKVLETEKEDSNGQVNLGVDNPGVIGMQKSESLDACKVVYVRQKSNQLVAAQGQQPGDPINSSMDKVHSLQPSTTSDLCFKKRKNQIILGSSSSDVPSAKDMTQAENLNSALQTLSTVGSFSHVWTLSGQHPQKKPFVGTSHMKVFPRMLPWKRKVLCQNIRSSYSPSVNTSCLGIVRKLLQTRKRGMVYTVSTNGFSLRKSGVLSIGGSSLKWSRSLEKGSQKVNEEATRAIAEVERKRREKRKRQSLRNKGRNNHPGPVAANHLRNNDQASSDSRVCNEYVRVNKGNQLVRNPKKVIRMLASEKVRWSLHTVRSRLAKKQQYCQFFTRFGECKKSGGKCPYIHDRAKVAICTKFLKGLCSNTSCKLTHKVLPERMPDCSYFLRGLCTNIACPYRHVKVNSNAPVCEGFLKGYCADGDECHKKHSYVCPVFEATGECPQQSRCKLHHPKKKIKSKRSRVDTLQNNGWGRYFDTSIGHDSEARTGSLEEEERQKQEHVSGGHLADFIDLGADIDSVADMDASDDIQLMELDSGNLKIQADNLDALIKPLRIMRTARV